MPLHLTTVALCSLLWHVAFLSWFQMYFWCIILFTKCIISTLYGSDVLCVLFLKDNFLFSLLIRLSSSPPGNRDVKDPAWNQINSKTVYLNIVQIKQNNLWHHELLCAMNWRIIKTIASLTECANPAIRSLRCRNKEADFFKDRFWSLWILLPFGL